MKKILSVILALTLILALSGCKKTNNTSSESEFSSELLISSNEEDVVSIEDNNSETTVVNSSEESKINSSTVTPSTNVNSKVNSNETTVSTNNSSQTTEENKPTTYFEKHNLKLSPLTTKMCFNTDKNHVCGTDGADEKSITITITNCADMKKDEYEIACNILAEENLDVSKYKQVLFENAMDFSYKIPRFPTFIFDKNTGIILSHHDSVRYYGDQTCCEGMEVWTEISINQHTEKIWSSSFGGGLYWWEWNCFCPKDYDGLVFVIMEDKNNCKGRISDGKIHTIDEVIDFENDKYYLFAANS